MKDGRPRLFLVSPPLPDPSSFPAQFAAAAAAGDVASLLVRCGQASDAARDVISAVMPTGYEHSIAILVEDDVDLAAESGADGVQIAGQMESYGRARTELGSDRIVGVLSNGSRHVAMELGEAGVDYIAFDQGRSLAIGSGDDAEMVNPLRWWSELFQVPCVAFAPVDAEAIEASVQAGADFVRPEDAMWSSADRAADTVRRYNARINELA